MNQPVIRYPLYDYLLSAVCCLLAGYTIFDIGLFDHTTTRLYDYTQFKDANSMPSLLLTAYCSLLTACCKAFRRGMGAQLYPLPPTLELFTCENN